MLSALALGLATAGTSLSGVISIQVASLFWQLDPIEVGTSIGITQIFLEITRIFGALAAVFLLSREVSASWISVGLLCVALSYALMGISDGVATYAAFRMLGELGRTIVYVACFAIVNEFVAESRRGTANMLLFLSIGLLILAGFFIGRLVFDNVDSAEWMQDSLLLVCGFFLILSSAFAMLSKKPFGLLIKIQSSQVSQKANVEAPPTSKNRFVVAILAIALGAIATILKTSFFSLWLVAASVDAGRTAAAALLEVSLETIWQNLTYFISLVFFGLLADRMNRLQLLLIALFISSLCFICIGLLDDPIGSLSVNLFRIYSIGWGGVMVTAMTLLAQETSKGRMARSIALSFMLGTFLSGIGLFVGGELFDRFGGAATFLFCGLLSAALLAWGIWIYRRSPGPSAAEFRSPNYQSQSGRA